MIQYERSRERSHHNKRENLLFNSNHNHFTGNPLNIAKKRPTIKDVAAAAGVSYQTVSRVINGQSGVVEPTRERILQAIETLGYRPSLAARSLPRRRTGIIGLIIPYPSDYLFRDPHLLAQLSGIDAEADANGYNVLLSTAGNSTSGLEAYERFVRNQFADGALVIETASARQGSELLSKQDYPFVGLGYGEGTWCNYFVHADDHDGARDAIRYLLQNGHRRIGIINGPSSGAVVAMEKRLTGYQQALIEAEISFDPNLMVYGDYTRAGGKTAANELLKLPQRPTAIFALNDRMAMGAIRAIHLAGLRVPEDIAVVGFDDVYTAVDFNPPLTTIRQPAKQIGHVAAQMLFKLIAGETITNNEIVLPAEVIIRQSA